MIVEANPDRVRLATAQDEPELLELCRRNHAENGLGSFAPEKVRAVFRRAFERGNEPAVIGVVGASCIEGSVGVVTEQPWDSETDILVTKWNYVLPEYRASSNLKDLTAWAERLSYPAPAGHGTPLMITAISTYRTEAQMRLYRRHMGEPVAVTWICETTYGGAL